MVKVQQQQRSEKARVLRKSAIVALVAAALLLLLATDAGWLRSTSSPSLSKTGVNDSRKCCTSSRRKDRSWSRLIFGRPGCKSCKIGTPPRLPPSSIQADRGDALCPTVKECRNQWTATCIKCLDYYSLSQKHDTTTAYVSALQDAQKLHSVAVDKVPDMQRGPSTLLKSLCDHLRAYRTDWPLSPFAVKAFHRLPLNPSGQRSAPLQRRAESSSGAERTATLESTRTSLNGHGIFAIIVFATVSLTVIRPIKLRLPQRMPTAVRSGKAWVRGKLIGDESDDASGDPSDAASQRSGLSGGTASARPMYITIDHVTAPLIGVLLLLATTTIGGDQIRTGIVGEDGIEPYDVLLLFISLAYIAISLDATGLLRYLAFLICLKSGKRGEEGSGKKLYLLLYFFFWTMGVLVGNDPVILSGTAFLVYLTRVAGISPPDAWIWGEFVAANVSSAVLVSSNPTNLVIATGFGVEFITYTAYMVLPALAGAVAALGCILVFFRNRNVRPAVAAPRSGAQSTDVDNAAAKAVDDRMRHRSTAHPVDASAEVASVASTSQVQENRSAKKTPLIYIPQRIIQPDVDARAALVDLPGAVFGSVVMAATLATLVGTSVVGGVKVFEIAVPGAVLCLLRDGVADYLRTRKEDKRLAKQKKEDAGKSDDRETVASSAAAVTVGRDGIPQRSDEAIELQPLPTPPKAVATTSAAAFNPQPSDVVRTPGESGQASPAPSSTRPFVAAAPVRPRRPLFRPLFLLPRRLARTFPTVTIVLSRLPLPLLPFAFSMFILVQALAHVGFINILARGLGGVCAEGYIVTAFFLSLLGVVLCNVGGTNIGATILLTKAVLSPFFQDRLVNLTAEERGRVIKMATYAIAWGSNVGACSGTFAASLAGLLWLEGLRQGGIVVRARQFATWSAVVIVPATVAGIAVLIAEVRYFDL